MIFSVISLIHNSKVHNNQIPYVKNYLKYQIPSCKAAKSYMWPVFSIKLKPLIQNHSHMLNIFDMVATWGGGHLDPFSTWRTQLNKKFIFCSKYVSFILVVARDVSVFSGSFKKRPMSWQAYVLSYWQTWEYSSPSLKPSHSIKNNRTKNRKIYLKRERFQNPSSRIALYHNVYFSNLDELFTF